MKLYEIPKLVTKPIHVSSEYRFNFKCDEKFRSNCLSRLVDLSTLQ